MAIGPAGPTPPGPGHPSHSKQHIRSESSSSSSSSDAAVAQAEAQAQQRAAQIQGQVGEIEQEGETELDHLHDDYERQYTGETSRQEAALENQKLKGYEALRQLQRAQAAEQARAKRDGDADLSKLKDYYRGTVYGERTRGDEDLRTLEKRQHQMYEYENRAGNDALEAARKQHIDQYRELKDDQDVKMRELSESTRRQYEKASEESAAASEKASHGINERYGRIFAEHQRELDAIQGESARKLAAIRQDTSDKLAAYRSRQEDPFYKARDMDTRLSEEPDRYVVTVRIPQFEQKDVSITVKGDQLVIAGYRRNEEKLNLGEGHVQGTNSFQSYVESYPLLWPVDTRAMVREAQGDTITVILPKRTMAGYRQYKSSPPRAQVERPQFPENLPYTRDDGEVSSTVVEPKLSSGNKGSGTLS